MIEVLVKSVFQENLALTFFLGHVHLSWRFRKRVETALGLGLR
jgi:Na+-transporting NADH:ubiquinone oxidoreductase subunit NqrE